MKMTITTLILALVATVAATMISCCGSNDEGALREAAGSRHNLSAAAEMLNNY